MKIHAVQTGITRIKTAFRRGNISSGGFIPAFVSMAFDQKYDDLPIMAWVIEHDEGIFVVDTGEASTTPSSIAAKFVVKPEEEIGPQMEQMGIRPKDVAKVILTHVHGDHIGGLHHFPDVPVIISAEEQRGLSSLMTRIAVQPPKGFNPQTITFRPQPFGVFEQSYPITQKGDIIAVPTPGHTSGHMSIIVLDGDTHVFLAGDVSYSEQSLIDQRFEGISFAPKQHPRSLRRVYEYTQQQPTVYLPSHDSQSAARLQARQPVPLRQRQK